MTNGDTTEGSPPVIFTRLMIISLLFNSNIMRISFSTSNEELGVGQPALLQKGQCALHPFVTFINKFTDGAI